MILVIVWLAVLGPMAVRYFRDGGSRDSVESFHEQMHLLERAGPKLVAPAHTLEGADPNGPSQAELASGTNRSGGDGVREMGSHAGLFLLEAPGTSAWVATRARTHRRRQGQRRRRDLVLVAMATVVLTGGLGAVSGLHLLWVVTAVSALLIAGCAVLGAYAQMLVTDRRASTPTPDARAAVPPPSPWSVGPVAEARRGRSEEAGSAGWTARAGFPGAWDDDNEGDFEVGKVAVGG